MPTCFQAKRTYGHTYFVHMCVVYLEGEQVGTVRRQHARLPQQLHRRREHLPVTVAVTATAAAPARRQTFFERSGRITGGRRFRRGRCTRRGVREGQQERQASLLRHKTQRRKRQQTQNVQDEGREKNSGFSFRFRFRFGFGFAVKKR